jgi:hypothetical protein
MPSEEQVRELVRKALGEATGKPSNLLWVLSHDDGAEVYNALVSVAGVKPPRSYVREELRGHLRGMMVCPTVEPEGIVAEGRDLVLAYLTGMKKGLTEGKGAD